MPHRQVPVVGMRYRPAKDFLTRKRVGTAIIMVPEPANPHDPDAVACYVTQTQYGQDEYTWVHAGYVARNSTSAILDRSKVYEGRILHKSNDFWDVSIEFERKF